MTFDLVLHEAAGDRQQGEALDDGQRLDQLQPGSLLRSEPGIGTGAVAARGVAVAVTVEFGNHRTPHRGEC